MIVYKATNKNTGKVYIGKTIRSLAHAKARHKQRASKIWKYGCESRFYTSINKHGWNSFEWEVIYNGTSDEDIQAKEKHFIAEMNSIDPNVGYNMTLGGDGSAGKKLSEAQKEKLSNTSSGSNNRCFGKYGEEHPAYGNKHNEATKERIRQAHLGKPKSKEQRKKLSEARKMKSRFSQEDYDTIVLLRNEGKTYAEIGKQFDANPAVVMKIYKRETSK